MWGMTLGPVTGRLLAEQIVTGVTPALSLSRDQPRSAHRTIDRPVGALVRPGLG